MPRKAKQTEVNDDSLLVTAAKTIGKAAGKIAAVSGIQSQPETTPARGSEGKLAPKNKSRLPRRQKKAQKKSGSAA